MSEWGKSTRSQVSICQMPEITCKEIFWTQWHRKRSGCSATMGHQSWWIASWSIIAEYPLLIQLMLIQADLTSTGYWTYENCMTYIALWDLQAVPSLQIKWREETSGSKWYLIPDELPAVTEPPSLKAGWSFLNLPASNCLAKEGWTSEAVCNWNQKETGDFRQNTSAEARVYFQIKTINFCIPILVILLHKSSSKLQFYSSTYWGNLSTRIEHSVWWNLVDMDKTYFSQLHQI